MLLTLFLGFIGGECVKFLHILSSGFLMEECVNIFENLIFGVSRGGMCETFCKSYFLGFSRGNFYRSICFRLKRQDLKKVEWMDGNFLVKTFLSPLKREQNSV